MKANSGPWVVAIVIIVILLIVVASYLVFTGNTVGDGLLDVGSRGRWISDSLWNFSLG